MENKWSGIHTLIVYSYPLISEYMSLECLLNEILELLQTNESYMVLS